MTARRGGSTLGCLVPLLIFSAVVYFGINVGEAYWRYIKYRDAMAQQVRFADRYSDQQIVARLQAYADSLGLPESARQIDVKRGENTIRIQTNYYERVELPLMVRDWHFHPRAEGTF